MTKSINDLAIMTKSGSNDAANELYYELRRYLAGTIKSRSIPGMDEDDIYHEIYALIITNGLEQWRGDSSFGTYCTSIAKRKLIDLWRASHAAKRITLDIALSIDAEREGDGGRIADNIVDNSIGRSCDEKLGELAGLLERVRDLGVLSDYEEETILYRGEGWKVKEIAGKMSRSRRSVSNAIQRARRKCVFVSKISSENSSELLQQRKQRSRPMAKPISPRRRRLYDPHQLVFDFLLAS
ncbi:RNA polymerase sigma factor [Poriferisphaera corsica]|nr:RNA polymerase sigma factor [Poriferisphaera corsica]